MTKSPQTAQADPLGIGIVITDHGSRREESNLRHERFVAEWRQSTGLPIVEAAHMEFAEPSIGTAFDACAASGALSVVIVPFFLGPGNHWEHDIPAFAAAAAARHPDVRYLVTGPLGPHPLLVDLVKDRVQHCLRHALDWAPACDLCAGTQHCQFRSQITSPRTPE